MNNTTTDRKLTKLGKYLSDRGITQTWLARKLGVEPPTVHRYCWGEIDLTFEKAMRIAEALEVPYSKIA